LPAPESWYPRCLYLRSDTECLLKNASFSAFGGRGTRVSLAAVWVMVCLPRRVDAGLWQELRDSELFSGMRRGKPRLYETV
jgi:hypothetical protein